MLLMGTADDVSACVRERVGRKGASRYDPPATFYTPFLLHGYINIGLFGVSQVEYMDMLRMLLGQGQIL